MTIEKVMEYNFYVTKEEREVIEEFLKKTLYNVSVFDHVDPWDLFYGLAYTGKFKTINDVEIALITKD